MVILAREDIIKAVAGTLEDLSHSRCLLRHQLSPGVRVETCVERLLENAEKVPSHFDMACKHCLAKLIHDYLIIGK